MKRATYARLRISNWPVISIHALVKRATTTDDKNIVEAVISIHALVKRATNWICARNYKALISIHALVKRATL